MLVNKFCLNGEWNLTCKEKNISLVGTIPASNYTMLLKAGLIDDPFVSTNEEKVQWVADYDWIFSRTFNLTREVIDSKNISLECNQLDTICEIYINDKLVGEADNCFVEHSFDIKNFVLLGENTISILFKSPVKYVSDKQAVENVPRNNNGQSGIPHIRKPQSHFGWDWGPVLPISGITRDIFIKYSNYEDIDVFDVKQLHENNVVTLSINASTKNEVKVNWQVKVLSPNNDILFDYNEESEKLSKSFTINNPELWWTYELSKKDKQPLYAVELSIINGESVVTSAVKKVGLRDIKLNRSNDKYGANFCFEINGVPIFAKGANIIPFDSMHDRVDEKVYDYYLDAARFSNFNILRVWGGGYYLDDYFYDKCDEYGILVWQDFMFACQPYPLFQDKLLNNVYNEVEKAVKRLKHHACLAVWCGNNEIEVMEIAWIYRKNYCKITEKFFYHLLPEFLNKLDKDLIYIEGSPCGIGYRKGHSVDNVGDTHLWAVWHGLQPLDYYRKRMTRFCSEFGFESLPDLKAIEKFASKDDYDLQSDVFNSHQKCASGNGKVKYYIASRFNLPTKFEDYIYLSQICQTECVKDATLHWRRNKGRCNGSMYWQFNDCWPVCSWSSLDYYGNYKALQYSARHFFNALTISVLNSKNKVELYLHNDNLQSKNVKIESKLIDFNGNVIFTDELTESISANSVKKVKDYLFNKMGTFDKLNSVLVFKLYEDNKHIDTITYLFDKEKNITLPKANICLDITTDKDDVVIELTSDKYCRYVSLYSKTNSNPFTDNYFDLIPNEKVVVRQKNTGNKTIEQLKEDYKVMSVCDLTSTGSRVKDNIERLKVLLIPSNLIQYLYYKIIPKDISTK